MATVWRWDQGRLGYFLFENLRKIAKSLVHLDGLEVNSNASDLLRPALEKDTSLPFLPTNYRVWRNYGRVFGCSLLATKVNERLAVSEICKNLASGSIREVDEYLAILNQKFRFPSPVFDSFDPSGKLIFPFSAILKLLADRSQKADFPNLTVEEVFQFLIGNETTGLEPISLYEKLKATNHAPTGDQDRQVREMMLVLSQFSFLKWADKKLFLDTSFDVVGFLNSLQFSNAAPKHKREEEFFEMARIVGQPHGLSATSTFETPIDLLFTEGKRTRISHLKIERSPLLRKLFFVKHPVFVCHMCEMQPRRRYPWTDNLLEIHHLLPLASGITVSTAGTSFDDIVPLCPTCHRSVHVFYKIWLDGNSKHDFSGKTEAKAVYSEAKKLIVL